MHLSGDWARISCRSFNSTFRSFGLFLTLFMSSYLSAQTLTTELNEAYYRRSHKEANRFFNQWEKQSKPTDKDKLNNTQRLAIELFDDYYTALEHKKNQSQASSVSQPTHKYLLIEPQINIYMKDTVYYSPEYISELKRQYEDRQRLSTDSSSDPVLVKPSYAPHFGYDMFGHNNAKLVDSAASFRPLLSVKNKKLLYLTPDYQRAINLYLGADATLLARGTFKQTLPETDVARRLAFITKHIPIQQGHLVDFHICNYPAPYSVIFDVQFEHARIDYMSGEQFGFAIFKCVDRRWILLFSSINGTI